MPFLEWHIENLIEKVGGVILLFLPDTHPADEDGCATVSIRFTVGFVNIGPVVRLYEPHLSALIFEDISRLRVTQTV
jgi:hypothetical protein